MHDASPPRLLSDHFALRTMRDRERFHRWYASRGGTPGRMPMLAGAPPFGTHLPGVTMTLEVTPRPKWPIAHRNVRALHGAMTAVLGTGHVHRFNTFILRQTDTSPSGWAVHWWNESAMDLADESVDGMLYGRPVTFTFGPAVRHRAPTVTRRGWRLVRVDTVTPVCFVSHGPSVRKPSGDVLVDTLAGESLTRFGLQYLKERGLVLFDVVQVEREQSSCIELGGKYGNVTGWEGSFVVRTNAPGHWLLEAAARTGMGARTAFGFGQVRVREEVSS